MSFDPGLVGVTECLTCDQLLQGYSYGFFPWSGKPAHWHCPDPRAIFDLERLTFPKRLLRTVRQERYRVTFDQAFRAVIEACRDHHRGNTWIDDVIIDCYTELHQRGYAHSVEVWEAEELVGGLYGVQIRKLFAGESMFSKKRDTSKIAFYHLCQKLKSLGVTLFDAQVANMHTRSLGVREIPRYVYMERHRKAIEGEGSGAVSWAIPDQAPNLSSNP